ncbi:MAG: hypothetical protein WC477_07340 [Patescibacteria group bacterium]
MATNPQRLHAAICSALQALPCDARPVHVRRIKGARLILPGRVPLDVKGGQHKILEAMDHYGAAWIESVDLEMADG